MTGSASRRWLAAAVAGVLVLLLAPEVLPARAAAATATRTLAPTAATGTVGGTADRDGGTSTLVVLDTSGSMNELTSVPGTSRLDAAISAVLDVMVTADPDHDLGLMTYPSTGSPSTAEGCDPASVRIPLRRPAVGAAMTTVRALSADGGTPTGPALRQAGEVLTARSAAGGTVVLVSDGEDNCGPRPCEVASNLVDDGIDVVVNTVGLDLEAGSAAATQLRCVASATGGRYVDATSDDVAQALLSQAAPVVGVSLEMPDEVLPTVGVDDPSGGGALAGTVVTGEVRNLGTVTARDVRVGLRFYDQDGVVGAAAVVPAVSYKANLPVGATRPVSFTVRFPAALVGQTVAWEAVAALAEGGSRTAGGTTRVVSAIDADRLGGVLDGVQRVVVMGDSYSSGEGAGVYTEDTRRIDGGDPGANRCHRSPLTYASQIWEQGTTNIACSGAVTRHWSAESQVAKKPVLSWPWDHASVPPQRDQLRGAVYDDAGRVLGDVPQAAVLTFGGNDIGFESIAASCTLGPSCAGFELGWEQLRQDPLGTTWDRATQVYSALVRNGTDRKLAGLPTALVAVYADADAVLNSPEVVRARGTVAPVVVLPYVRVVPRNGFGPADGCQAGFDAAEVVYLNAVLDRLNAAIAQAVRVMQDRGRPVYLASSVVEALQPSSTVCDRRPAAVSDGSLLLVVAAAAAGKVVSADVLERSQQLLHPNQDGYAAIATALVGWSQTSGQVTAEAAGIEVRDRPTPGAGPWGDLQRTMTTDELQGGTSATGSGFLPGGEVVAWVESRPRTIGTATAGPSGAVDAWLPFPAELEPGRHTVVLQGLAPDGTLRVTREPVTVARAGTRWAQVGLGAGAVLLAVAGACVWSRRRART